MKIIYRNPTAQPIKTVNEIRLLSNKFVHVFNDHVQFRDGSKGHYFRYNWNCDYGTCCIVEEDEYIYLLEIYRYQEQSWSIEIPQGFGEDGLSPEENMQKECREELGLETINLKKILTTSNGGIPVHLFKATVDKQVEMKHESGESIRHILKANKEDCMNLISSGRISDPNTIIGILYFINNYND
ncbi:NUDIX hydrolase [Vibrio barjaei]|uniref:NUDIX hydrolase n=1 Tax=Vibrio barjaei TaxID=1676683 RepID=UPI0022851DEA|nr:NUDIX hydrolase [Vibrio barjaei]MCY9872342.1 NUDIX hydrolase [Vibrio barjaei]